MTEDLGGTGASAPVPPVLFTVGYEGIAPPDLISILLEAGVRTLVDVRELPLSRRPGFSKSALRASLERAGIRYLHERRLGTPRQLRQALRADRDVQAFRGQYRAVLADREPELLELASRAATEPTAILCFEADPRVCHRAVIAEQLEARGLVRTQHLGFRPGTVAEP